MLRLETTLQTSLFVMIVTVAACGEDGSADGGSDASDASEQDTAVADSQPDDASTQAWLDLQIGRWDGSFTPLDPSASHSFELVAGPQGGFHIDLSASLRIATVDNINLTAQAYAAADNAPLAFEVQRSLSSSRVRRFGELWIWTGEFLVFDTFEPSDVVGEHIVLEVIAARGPKSTRSTLRGVVVDNEP